MFASAQLYLYMRDICVVTYHVESLVRSQLWGQLWARPSRTGDPGAPQESPSSDNVYL